MKRNKLEIRKQSYKINITNLYLGPKSQDRGCFKFGYIYDFIIYSIKSSG